MRGRAGGGPGPRTTAPTTRALSRVVAAIVLASILAAPPAAAQYFEPTPRRSGVQLPPEVEARQAEEAALLGISTVEGLAAARGVPRLGTMPFLVIPALFADSPEPHVTAEEIHRILFEGPTEQGTLAEFYREASGGRFEFAGTVAPWVRTSVTIAEAAGERDGHGFIGERIGDYIVEAIRLADEHVDFGEFDGDGDGIVDALAVEFLEPAGSCGGPGIWPHLSTTRRGTDDHEPYATDDLTSDGQPVRVDPYITESVSDCTGEGPQGIEVLAHELGHVLGLPDYYRPVTGPGPGERHWNLGCFALMAGGAWGCGTGPKVEKFGPVHFAPLSRAVLGWIEPIEVEEADDEEFALEPAVTSGDALFVRLGPGSPETFQLEYRPRTGFDDGLPAGGVLVYHHDAFELRRSVRPEPGTITPYPYHLVEADGDDALRKLEVDGGNRGEAGDVFSADGGEAILDASTTPSTRTHSGHPSTLTIHSIRVEGGVARVRLTVGSNLVVQGRELPLSWEALAPYEGRFTVSGGTGPYEVRSDPPDGFPDGLELAVDGDRVVLVGRPLQAGEFPVVLTVVDADGDLVYESFTLEVRDVVLNEGNLVAALVEGPGIGLTDLQARYLDLSGNRNGGFDLGDLRAYVIRGQER